MTSASIVGGELYRDRVLRDGAVGYWRLGEAVGSGTVADGSSNGYTGTVVAGVTLGQTGAISDGDTAALFNGSTGEIDLPSIAAPAAVTIEAWAKRGAISSRQFMIHLFSGLDLEFDATNHLTLNVTGQGAICVATSTVTDAAFHHLVATYNGAIAHLYTDNVDVSGTTTVRTYTTGQGWIGCRNNLTSFFSGVLDELAVYPSVFSVQQVEEHYTLRLSLNTEVWRTPNHLMFLFQPWKYS